MTTRQGFSANAAAAAVMIAGIALGTAPSFAGEMSAQQIISGLKVTTTPSFDGSERPALTAEDRAFVKRVRGQTRSLSLDDRKEMDAIVTKRPAVDLDIKFDYNSAALTPTVEPQLNSLGSALTSPALLGSVIMLGGHTDAKGSDEYNQEPFGTAGGDGQALSP